MNIAGVVYLQTQTQTSEGIGYSEIAISGMVRFTPL